MLGKRMAYHRCGSGRTVVFLHGNPTSSYLWRNVIPHVFDIATCVAPDLIGMGDSEKLVPSGPDRYRFVEHRNYLDEFLRLTGGDSPLVLVVHDWGSALGFDWARRNPQLVAGICYMESIIAERRWDEWPEPGRRFFQGLRSEADEKMVIERNMFVERVLAGSIQRKLSDAEMDEYRRPFRNPGEDRRPTLTWPRQIPIEGEPADRGPHRVRLRRMDGRQRLAEAVHQHRGRHAIERTPPRNLPDLEEPARGHGQGRALFAGGFAARDRRRAPGMADRRKARLNCGRSENHA